MTGFYWMFLFYLVPQIYGFVSIWIPHWHIINHWNSTCCPGESWSAREAPFLMHPSHIAKRRQDFLKAHDIDDPYDGENLCLQRTINSPPKNNNGRWWIFPWKIWFSHGIFQAPKEIFMHKTLGATRKYQECPNCCWFFFRKPISAVSLSA